jgi:ElaB/YqjD/DUF883 family membrane-anchored ribosome-binding protein
MMYSDEGFAPRGDPEINPEYIENPDYLEDAVASTGETTETGEDPNRIRGDIEGTRTQMSQTIDEIQERLSPQRLVNETKETVREATLGRAEQVVNEATDTARSAGQGIWATIRENPIPTALVGIGLGWLFYKSRERMPSGESRYMAHDGYYRPSGAGYGGPVYRAPVDQRDQAGAGDRVKDKASQVTGQAADQAQRLAGQAGDKARQAAGQAQETMGQFTDQAQYQAQRARGWLERSWDENPLAMSGLALAAGAILGMALPETQPENELMGQARDTLAQKAQGAVQDTMQKAQTVAEQASGAAKDAAKDAAQQQGLTSQSPS